MIAAFTDAPGLPVCGERLESPPLAGANAGAKSDAGSGILVATRNLRSEAIDKVCSCFVLNLLALIRQDKLKIAHAFAVRHRTATRLQNFKKCEGFNLGQP
jgi:hypothetical protein